MNHKIKAFVFDAYGTLYDVQSVEMAVEAVFPGDGALIANIWRMKQLEYSWLATLMGRYEDFWSLTLRSLDYTLCSLRLNADGQLLQDIAAAYLDLRPYDDALSCLERLAPSRRLILSNGSPSMLASLVTASKLDSAIDGVLSVDAAGAFKPAPQAYALVEKELDIARDEVAFISSNGFDVCGAKSFGFTVVHVQRSSGQATIGEKSATMDERLLYRLMRGHREALDLSADVTVQSLDEIPALFGVGGA
jgi:2-haloacid dehalogenase